MPYCIAPIKISLNENRMFNIFIFRKGRKIISEMKRRMKETIFGSKLVRLVFINPNENAQIKETINK